MSTERASRTGILFQWFSAAIAMGAIAVAILVSGVLGSVDPSMTLQNLGPEQPMPTFSDEHPIHPIVARDDLDAAKVALGRLLFHDPRLSGSGRMSCATCHDLDRFGVDGRKRSMGSDGELQRNAPTVYNAALHFRQFWDGRALTLEDQIDGPLLSAAEMGATWALVLKRLGDDPEMREKFERSYDGISPDSVRHAIAEFERSLLTPDAPFDRFLRGDEGAISALAQEGYRLFRSYGCTACHQGVAVGGNMFQRFGVMRKPNGVEEVDQGRFAITGDQADRFVFKVPSLRNVYETGPYFHDGSVATLPEAVQIMAGAQLGIRLPEEEVRAIVVFLKSLTGVRPQ